MLSPEEMKRVAGEYAVGFVQPGFVTGIGTGSTVYYFIHALAEKVKQGLDITAVVTSRKSGELSKQLGITVTDLNDVDTIDITIDGADEVDTSGNLIKGGGGALLQDQLAVLAEGRALRPQIQQRLAPSEVDGRRQQGQRLHRVGVQRGVEGRQRPAHAVAQQVDPLAVMGAADQPD